MPGDPKHDGKVGKSVKFSELFADKDTLLLYSFMFGPNWDKPCPSCTSLVDGFDRTWYQVTQGASFVAIAKAPADRINAWAKQRGWSQIWLVSGSESPYQADYKCQGDTDDMQWPVMHVFMKRDGKIFHFWGTESSRNHLDTVWPYWNLMDFTPEGRPDIPTPPQTFRSEFLEKHYLMSQLQNSLGAGVQRTRGEGGHRVLQVCVRSDGRMAVNGQVFDRLARPVSRRDDIRRNKAAAAGQPGWD